MPWLYYKRTEELLFNIQAGLSLADRLKYFILFRKTFIWEKKRPSLEKLLSSVSLDCLFQTFRGKYLKVRTSFPITFSRKTHLLTVICISWISVELCSSWPTVMSQITISTKNSYSASQKCTQVSNTPKVDRLLI